MDTRQITLVQDSFAQVAPIADEAARLFYAKLFAANPDLKPLFKGDMAEQGRKLMATLGVVVKGLDDLGPLVPVAEALAVRHVAYGVEPKDYAPVGAALLDTLREGLGEAFTPEVEAAWAEAYGTLSGVMIDAAYGLREAAQ